MYENTTRGQGEYWVIRHPAPQAGTNFYLADKNWLDITLHLRRASSWGTEEDAQDALDHLIDNGSLPFEALGRNNFSVGRVYCGE